MKLIVFSVLALCFMLLGSCDNNIYNVQGGPVVSIYVAPQPASNYASFSYTLLESAPVTVTIENLTGVVINTLVNNTIMSAGKYMISLKLDDYESGYYIIKIKTSDYIYKTMLVVKK